jgi:hypothetical protein
MSDHEVFGFWSMANPRRRIDEAIRQDLAADGANGRDRM